MGGALEWNLVGIQNNNKELNRVLYFSPQNNKQGLRVNLDLLEESRLAIAIKNEA